MEPVQLFDSLFETDITSLASKSLPMLGHTHDVSIIWNFWPFTWFTWPFAWLLNIIFFPIWILFLPLQLVWNFIPDVVTLVIVGLLLLPWIILFTFVFGTAGFFISVIVGTIMLFLFAFI